jgi:hypothetical protein
MLEFFNYSDNFCNILPFSGFFQQLLKCFSLDGNDIKDCEWTSLKESHRKASLIENPPQNFATSTNER